MAASLALTLTIAGCVCLYLASPHQKWLAQVLRGRLFLVAGVVLAAAGLAAWIVALRPLAGFFVALHIAMLCLCVFPYAAALRGFRRKG